MASPLEPRSGAIRHLLDPSGTRLSGIELHRKDGTTYRYFFTDHRPQPAPPARQWLNHTCDANGTEIRITWSDPKEDT